MPWGFQEVQASKFRDSRHMKVVRLSALRTARLYPPGNIPGTHFCCRLSQPQGHSVAGRIISMKNSYDTIRNRTHDLPVCSAVPQPTAQPCNPHTFSVLHVNTRCNVMYWVHRPALQESVWLTWIWERGARKVHTIMLTEWLTSRQRIRAYFSMNVMMLLQIAMLRETFITYITHMDFFQYVSDNESSVNSVEWKINYYTFHRCTDVPQYVHGDASSDDCDGWRIY